VESKLFGGGMQESSCYEKSKNGVYLKVKAVPKSSKNEVIGIVGGRMKVAVRAVPQNGEANRAVEEVVAAFFAVKKSDCAVVAGHKSSLKTLFITGDAEELRRFIENLIPCGV
jgi:uncharacterized protein (TIGR00251 family)